jgi:chromosome segregation ATPase
MEQRRGRDLIGINRKLERQLAEIRVQADEDSRVRSELQEQFNSLTIRVKTLRRQLEEAEEVVTITMNKYRKAQAMIEEADHRADMAERTIVTRSGRGRSMSVTREITRVIKV